VELQLLVDGVTARLEQLVATGVGELEVEPEWMVVCIV